MRQMIAAASAVLVLGCGQAAVLANGSTKVAMLEISGTPTGQPSPFNWLFGDAEPTLRDYVQSVRTAAGDASLDAIVVRLKDATLTTAQIHEIGAALNHAREHGKRVVLFAENYGGAELLLGAHADQRLIQSGGGVFFPGVLMEEMYLADMLEWAGVKAQLVQVGDYKGANETMTRTAPSKAWDDNITNLLDGIYGNLTTTLGRGMGMSSGEVEDALGKIWFADGATGVEAGVIDAEVDLAVLTDWLGSHMDAVEIAWTDLEVGSGGSSIDTSNPFAIFQMLSRTPSHTPKRETIAIVHVEGAIMDGDSSAGSLFGGATAGSRTLRNALETVLAEDQIKGVIVRIDSPGGSAIASEVIWQGLERVKSEKPVWVSIGDMAASGGYYIAVGGDKIYANPSSIVGSIGVVGGKYAVGDLYDKLKINVVTRSRGPMAEMFASNQPWDERQQALIREKMAETYDLFASRVRSGRPSIDLDKTAEGRLFVGTQAVELGMVDAIGGLEETITDLAGELGLARYDVMHYPGPKSFDDFMKQLTRGFGVSAGGVQLGQGTGPLDVVGAALRDTLGERRWSQVRDALNGALLLRDEPVILISPRALIFR
ncbi:MAG: signal peptide peptidase SppA [Phycisphaerales bacterium]|nr:MAG: signal peptide peptidase SppA [Phycisphaerales bacterium]